MARTMYDGVNSDAVWIKQNFPNAALVAGYCNGRYAWTAADWKLFPGAVHVWISVTASDITSGDVLDVENGDATPAQTEAWIAGRKKNGCYRPTIYCSLSNVPAVRTGTGKYVLGTDYDLWVADYDGSTSSVYTGSAAKQYKSEARYDESVVFDDAWPHRTAPKPAPAPAPKPAPKPAPAPAPAPTAKTVTLDIGGIKVPLESGKSYTLTIS